MAWVGTSSALWDENCVFGRLPSNGTGYCGGCWEDSGGSIDGSVCWDETMGADRSREPGAPSRKAVGSGGLVIGANDGIFVNLVDGNVRSEVAIDAELRELGELVVLG